VDRPHDDLTLHLVAHPCALWLPRSSERPPRVRCLGNVWGRPPEGGSRWGLPVGHARGMTISAEQLEQLLGLDDPSTNPVLAHAIAIIAQDEALTAAQLMRLAEVREPVIAGAVVFNLSSPTEAVRRVAEMHPDLREVAGGHPHAPMEWKLELPAHRVSFTALDVFFAEVQATKGEKAKVHRRLAGDRTLGDIWLEVRPH
jgi:hypothetical protein